MNHTEQGGLSSEQALRGKIRIACQIHAQLSQSGLVSGSRNVGHMDLAARQFFEFLDCHLRCRVHGSANAESDQGFLQIEADHFSPEHVFFEMADRFHNIGRQ